MSKKILGIIPVIVAIAAVFLPLIVLADFELPPGEAWTLERLKDEVIDTVASWLMAAGIVGGIITLIISGIMYMKAGSNAESAKKARAIFIGGLKGSAIVLGTGVIINTIFSLITGEFFTLF